MKNLFTFISMVFIPISLFSQNDVCFELEGNPYANHPAFGIFSKYVNVLGCINIFSESNIPDEKVLHVASVVAELLDNDEDGIVDDPLIEASLIELNTIMPVFQSENGTSIETFFDNFDDGCTGAVLFRNEIDPNYPGHWGNDATVEEVLHTINACGHVEVYPSLYTLEPNSSYLTDAMDVARGGQFTTIPDSYPDEAWYHYDDWTCEYDCMAMDYLYWCIVTNMGILSDTQTCNGIANEWEPCTQELFEVTDTLMFNLVTNPENKLPQLAPDGNYCPANVEIKKNTNSMFFPTLSNYPNPFNPITYIKYNLSEDAFVNITIYNVLGKVVNNLVTKKQSAGYKSVQWNATNNAGSLVGAGIYLYMIQAGEFKKTSKMILLK